MPFLLTLPHFRPEQLSILEFLQGKELLSQLFQCYHYPRAAGSMKFSDLCNQKAQLIGDASTPHCIHKGADFFSPTETTVSSPPCRSGTQPSSQHLAKGEILYLSQLKYSPKMPLSSCLTMVLAWS